MKSSVRFLDGLLLDASLYVDEECVFNVTHQSKALRNCLLCYLNGELRLYKIMRKSTFRQTGIRVLINELSTNLEIHYQKTFTGLFWGIPEVSYENNKRVFALNGTILFREDGYLFPTLQHVLSQHQITITDIPELLNFMNSFTSPITT